MLLEFIHLKIAALIYSFKHKLTWKTDNSKHENTNPHESQTIDFRLLFFLASTTKVMSTVKPGTLLFQANNQWYKMMQHDIAIWHSQDMAFTNMKTTIYLIIQDLSRIDHLQKQSIQSGATEQRERSCEGLRTDETGLI